jgi:hypothetical protein
MLGVALFAIKSGAVPLITEVDVRNQSGSDAFIAPR